MLTCHIVVSALTCHLEHTKVITAVFEGFLEACRYLQLLCPSTSPCGSSSAVSTGWSFRDCIDSLRPTLPLKVAIERKHRRYISRLSPSAYVRLLFEAFPPRGVVQSMPLCSDGLADSLAPALSSLRAMRASFERCVTLQCRLSHMAICYPRFKKLAAS